MGRTNTAIWEEIKSEHTICLCYSESKGLYVSSIYFAPEEEILFLPHGYKGFWEREVQVPKDNLSIKIKTNFGYGSMTYMKAIVERDGKRLLDFDKSSPTSTFPPQNFPVIQHLQFLHIYCGYYKFSNSTELG